MEANRKTYSKLRCEDPYEFTPETKRNKRDQRRDTDDDDDDIDEIIASPMRTRTTLKPASISIRAPTNGSPANTAIPSPENSHQQTTKQKNGDSQTQNSIYPEIDNKSLRSLEPGRMLNDTIIEFYMNYLMEEAIAKKRDRFHLFNTFIYNKLKSLQRKVQTNGNSESCFSQTIRRWDKNVKLFEKDFLVMPVCDHEHWLLVIICYAYRVPAHDEPLVINDHVRSSTTGQTTEKEPCILIFDSLGYKQMTKFTEPIRSFLTYRWRFEHPNEEPKYFKDRSTFRDINARVPRQRNSYDCGIHLLVSFERFLEHPVHYYKRIKAGEDVCQEFREPDTHLKRHKIRSLSSSLSSHCVTNNQIFSRPRNIGT